jgi:hypothetical protein
MPYLLWCSIPADDKVQCGCGVHISNHGAMITYSCGHVRDIGCQTNNQDIIITLKTSNFERIKSFHQNETTSGWYHSQKQVALSLWYVSSKKWGHKRHTPKTPPKNDTLHIQDPQSDVLKLHTLPTTRCPLRPQRSKIPSLPLLIRCLNLSSEIDTASATW